MIRIFVICLLAVIQAGCTTTGDPTKGGLLGWSKSKADQRASEAENAANAATQAADAEHQRSQTLTQKLNTNRSTRNQYKTTIDHLLEENQRLHEKLSSLSESNRNHNTELKLLEAERDKLIQESTLKEEAIENGQPHQFSSQLSELNERYKEAILMLLQH